MPIQIYMYMVHRSRTARFVFIWCMCIMCCAEAADWGMGVYGQTWIYLNIPRFCEEHNEPFGGSGAGSFGGSGPACPKIGIGPPFPEKGSVGNVLQQSNLIVQTVSLDHTA